MFTNPNKCPYRYEGTQNRTKDKATSGIKCQPKIGLSWTEPRIDIRARMTGLKKQSELSGFA